MQMVNFKTKLSSRNVSQIGRVMFGDTNDTKSPMKITPIDLQLMELEMMNPNLQPIFEIFFLNSN